MRERIRKAPEAEEFKPCTKQDCRYRAPEGSRNNCDYIAITGRSRIGQHPVGQRSPHKCRLYDPGVRECVPIDSGAALPGSMPNAKPRRVQPKNRDWSVARKLHDAGAKRTEIARAMHCSLKVVDNWIKREGLTKPPIDWDKAWAMWAEGMTIEKMAKALGCSTTAVKNWARREGLTRAAKNATGAKTSDVKSGHGT